MPTQRIPITFRDFETFRNAYSEPVELYGRLWWIMDRPIFNVDSMMALVLVQPSD